MDFFMTVCASRSRRGASVRDQQPAEGTRRGRGAALPGHGIRLHGVAGIQSRIMFRASRGHPLSRRRWIADRPSAP